MTRVRTIKNVFDKKDKTFKFNGIWFEVMDDPETNGGWIVYGREKNGKTTLALMLSEYLSKFEKTLYVSAEEGIGANFKKACKRAGLDVTNNRLQFLEYTPLEELTELLSKQRSAKIIFIDNTTVYNDELKNGGLRKLLSQHQNKLFVFVSHEERNEPDTSTAKLIKKLAKIIVRVQGLACEVSGRCTGGRIMIDKEKAQLYHGTEIIKS